MAAMAGLPVPVLTAQRLEAEFVEDLRRALRAPGPSRELDVVYQPQVDLGTGRVVGAEALVRWAHPRLGPLGPSSFIPMAERTGLVEPLGRWVLSRALSDLRAWPDRCTGPAGGLEVSVNVAAAQVTPRLVADVEQACGAAAVAPSRLVLELTETSRIDPRVVGDPLQRLRGLGVRIALDDFGTGWSPLSHLHVLPVDVLKLDRTFVTGPHGRAADAIARAVTAMADDLGLQVVAEGIETPAERARMVRFGCRTGQGYLFARPMPAAALTDLLEPTATAARVGGRAAS